MTDMPQQSSPQQSGQRQLRPAFVFSVLGILILGIGIYGFFTWERFNPLVIIKADQTPIKTVPQDAGGKKLDSIDSPVLSFFDAAGDDDGDDDGAVEVIVPPTAEPNLPPISVDSIADSKTPDNETPNAPNTAPPDNNSASLITPTITDQPTFMVQFAAFSKLPRAIETADALSQQHEAILDGVHLGYMQKGDYWLVVTEGMAREAAVLLCTQFRAAGQSCISKLVDVFDG